MQRRTAHTSDLTAVLPPELLASCFHWLPFLDRVRAACVSRYWRSTALQFPALWSDIRLLDGRSENSLGQLARMALARSGRHPVNLDCGLGSLVPTLREHMDHIRSIWWFGSDLDCFTVPAPMLERFVCAASVPLPSNFLAGQPGVLHRLELRSLLLPATCPAIANVTYLATDPPNSDLAPALNRLWQLCPRLETLCLHDLPQVSLSATNPPPSTLAYLQLRTTSQDCDLGQFFWACASPALKEVTIFLPLDRCRTLSDVVREALELEVQPGHPLHEGPVKSILAVLPGGCRLQLLLTDVEDGHRKFGVVDKLTRENACFPQLRALTMPLLVFHLFIRKRPHLPMLQRLCIIVQQTPSGVGHFDWTRIYCLAFVRHYAVTTITFDVRYMTETADKVADASALGKHISEHTKPYPELLCGVRYVVRGFSAEVVCSVQIPQCGLQLSFDCHDPATQSGCRH